MSLVSSGNLRRVGRVLSPHGVAGLLRVWCAAGLEPALHNTETAILRGERGADQEKTLVSFRPHKNAHLLKLEDVDTREEAEALRGADILVAEELIPREEDEYFGDELLGLRVYTEEGECLGSIFRIVPTRANDLYVVKQGEREIYIPATHDVVRDVDLVQGTMIVSPMEGLLELNEV